MTIRIEDIGKEVRTTQYAVRGPIVARAAELERAGREIIYCNIGNPQSLGQKPLTWIRQVLALVSYPELMDSQTGLFPADVVATSRLILQNSKFGAGAYTESQGLRFIREAIAEFIQQRDGIPANPDHLFLTDGASKGVQAILRMLLASPRDGIMVPVPQYPLYSATITLFDGRRVDYYLEESTGWKLNLQELERAYQKAQDEGTRVKAICVINPGNPTGSVLDEANINMVLNFARTHQLSILADEVYQDNIYGTGDTFVSFAKVLEQKSMRDLSLFSFHSCSKGLLGECGLRGGYLECRNVPDDVMAEITKLQSISLCANTIGQFATYLMVSPPIPGNPSYETYHRERRAILESLRDRAKILANGLNKVPGIHCQPVTGAMYAFPSIALPAGMTDTDYCQRLLEETGICVVPGSGFGQVQGTFHFRTTILPPTHKIEDVVAIIAKFHLRVCPV